MKTQEKISVEDKKNDTCTENAADNIYKEKSYACKNCTDIVRNIDSNPTNPKQRHLSKR